jgi:antitoxin CptB
MKNKKNLIKQIIYRSSHRGSKEMDLLLGNFVKKYINVFDDKDLSDLYELLSIEDEIIYKWYFKKENNLIITNNKITKMLKEYKF